jgi:DNA-binding MarR family transcriptional regulator
VAETRWLDEREEGAWRAVQRMQAGLSAALARRLAAESNLSYPDYEVLAALTEQPDGRLRPVELGQLLGWEKSRLSHHLARMEQRGLIAKQHCETDRRGAFVAITLRGRRENERAAPGHVAAVRQLFIDPLTPAQLDALAEAADCVLGAVHPTAPERASG